MGKSPYRIVDGKREKKCSLCGEWKHESEFYSNCAQRPGKLVSACKVCEKVHKQTSKEKKRARKASRRSLLKQYGLTSMDYDLLLSEQSGCCAICGEMMTISNVDHDHDHQTGAVRGLLCNLCNVMLGSAHDDPVILASAIEYLETYPRSTFTFSKGEEL